MRKTKKPVPTKRVVSRFSFTQVNGHQIISKAPKIIGPDVFVVLVLFSLACVAFWYVHDKQTWYENQMAEILAAEQQRSEDMLHTTIAHLAKICEERRFAEGEKISLKKASAHFSEQKFLSAQNGLTLLEANEKIDVKISHFKREGDQLLVYLTNGKEIQDHVAARDATRETKEQQAETKAPQKLES